MSGNNEQQLIDRLREAAQRDQPAPDLTDRVLDHLAYRARLELPRKESRYSAQVVASALGVVAAAAALALFVTSRHAPHDPAITPERTAPAGNRNRGGPAEADAPAAPESGAARKSTRAPISGRIRGSRSRMLTLTCTVARWRSAVGTTCRTRPRNEVSWYASRVICAG